MDQHSPTTLTRSPPSLGEGETATVVVGLNGSAASWSAFWWACGEARRLEADVICVYVTPSIGATLTTAAAAGCDVGTYVHASDEPDAARAAEPKDELAQRTSGLDVEIRLLHLQGDTAEQLTRVAHETRFHVIAVGRSTKLRHYLAASLGRRLTFDRKAPIIVIVP